MKPWWLALALFAVAAGAAARALRDLDRPGFRGDGVGYYAPLASLLFDGDLDLSNELAHLSPSYRAAAFMTPDGRLGDPFPIGPALLWAPAVWACRHLPANAILDAPLAEPPRTPHPAFAPRFARVVQWTDMLLVLLGGAVLVAALSPLHGAVRSAVAGIAVVLGTPVFYYTLVDPSYGHAASLFASSLFVAAAWIDRQRRLPLELLGFLWGFVALVRSQDAVLGALLAPRLIDTCRGRRGGGVAVPLLRVAVPAVVAFLPQMMFWWRIYGRALLVPPGPDFLPFWMPHILPLLFSTWNGVLVWSPVLMLGIAGLACVSDRRLRTAAGVSILLGIYSSSILLDWWGGTAFGPRRLVALAPLAAVGVAELLDRWWREARVRCALLAVLLALLCGASVRLAEYKLHGLLPANPGSAADYVRHYTPGSRHALPYGWWDYPRFVSEAIESERLLRIDKRRARAASE